MLTLVLSDVVGDPLDVIASGPTVPDTSAFKDALDILEKYALTTKIPKGMLAWLEEGREGKRRETPKQGSKVFEKTFTVIIGNNRLALEAAAGKASSLGFNTSIISDTLKGELTRVAEEIIETAIRYRFDKAAKKPAALLFGGEPTIKVTGNGLGGRNQHLALLCSLMLKGSEGITLLSAGTDGNDGPTEAAGAVVDSDTAARAIESGADPEDYLDRFDSFNFFGKVGGHVITGPTMTNVMDIIVILVL
jgi:glycerate-2-kinase